jgi:hypothetical protein
MRYLYLISAFLVVGTGCSRNSSVGDDSFRYSFSVDAIEKSNLSRPDAAEEIAKGAEQLLNAKSFEQADRVASDALKLDPSNLRAGFIKALLAPLLLQKGILARIRPLAERSPKLKKDWDKAVEDCKAKPDEKLNSYYLDGRPDISTEKELQKYVDTVVEALEKFRLFLRDRRNSEITMISSPLFVPDANIRYAYSCKITATANRSYELVCPPSFTRHQVSLNRADFESLQAGAGFYELYLALPNGYDLSGSVDSIKDMSEILPKDYQKIADDIMASAKFGTLRIPNTFSKARGWGLDIVNSFVWANENQELTCKSGQENPTNRPGYFFNKGICVVNAFKPLLDTAAKAVTTRGPVPVDLGLFNGEKKGIVQMNLFAPFENPLPSLKQIGFLKFNQCGKLVDIQDKTVAGAFPNGDALTAFDNPKCD